MPQELVQISGGHIVVTYSVEPNIRITPSPNGYELTVGENKYPYNGLHEAFNEANLLKILGDDFIGLRVKPQLVQFEVFTDGKRFLRRSALIDKEMIRKIIEFLNNSPSQFWSPGACMSLIRAEHESYDY